MRIVRPIADFGQSIGIESLRHFLIFVAGSVSGDARSFEMPDAIRTAD
jgi:hypothetical protein